MNTRGVEHSVSSSRMRRRRESRRRGCGGAASADWYGCAAVCCGLWMAVARYLWPLYVDTLVLCTCSIPQRPASALIYCYGPSWRFEATFD